MTEDRVERAMEHFGDVVEKTAEGAAAVLDKSMNFAWGFRPVRFVSRSLTFLTGAGLMAGSIPLEERGYSSLLSSFARMSYRGSNTSKR